MACPHTQLAHTQLVHTQLVIRQHGIGLALVARLVLGVTPWRRGVLAWHVAISIFTLRGRRGTYGTGPALVAHRVPK